MLKLFQRFLSWMLSNPAYLTPSKREMDETW